MRPVNVMSSSAAVQLAPGSAGARLRAGPMSDEFAYASSARSEIAPENQDLT